MRFMKIGLICLTAIFMSVSLAQAGEVTITQGGKKFSEKEITISVGDTVKFVNDDKFTHNIFSNSKAGKFDLGAQKPGAESKHVFTKPGKYKVSCAIHPKMKLTVIVQ